MKNKLKYLVGTIVFALIFLVSAQGIEATITNIDAGFPSTIKVGDTKIISATLTGNTANETGTLSYEYIIGDANMMSIVIPVNDFTMPGTSPIRVTLNVVITGIAKGSVEFRLKVGNVNSADFSIEVVPEETEPGGEVGLGDKCSSDKICSGSELNCTWCEDKPGLPCVDPKGRVCLGANGYDCGEVAIPLGEGDGLNKAIPKGNDLICMNNAVCKGGDCVPDYGGGEVPSGIGRVTTDIRDQIRSIINIALGFLGVAGAIIVIYGGVLWMTARGNDEQVTKAKSTIVSGVIGIIIILLAWTIVSYVLKIGEQVGT